MTMMPEVVESAPLRVLVEPFPASGLGNLPTMKNKKIKIAYLIIAHKSPQHLRRLIATLNDIDVEFFIHIDKKSDLNQFKSIINLNNVEFVKSNIKVNWSGFSLVRSTIKLIEISLDNKNKFDFYILLSGLDYPIKSNFYIKNFLHKNKYEFISLHPMPIHRKHENKSLERIESCYIENIFHFKCKILNKTQDILLYYFNIFLAKFFRIDFRKRLRGMVLYGGHQWWALSNGAIEYINDFIRGNPWFSRTFRFSRVPDEMFFHTIIGNSRFASRTRPCLTFTEWGEHPWHPDTIGMKHLEKMKMTGFVNDDEIYGKGEFLFVRKFDEKSDPILDRIDREFINN